MEAVGGHRPSFLSLATKPVRDVFVLTERSTRTEALGFVLLTTMVGQIPVSIAGDLSNSLRTAVGLALGLILHLPIYALFVRRMHDLGRSGRWVWIPALQTAAALALLFQPNVGGGTRITFLIWNVRPVWDGTSAILLSTLLALLAIEIFLFFWPGTPGPNRYGPDPRGAIQPG